MEKFKESGMTNECIVKDVAENVSKRIYNLVMFKIESEFSDICFRTEILNFEVKKEFNEDNLYII